MPEAQLPLQAKGALLVPAKWQRPRSAGLDRERLHRALESLWRHGFGLVSGPAGAGKTTVLAQFSARCETPVAWYSADSTERNPQAFVAYLKAGLGACLPDLPLDSADSVDGLAAALHAYRRPALVVVDDLQELEGSPAEKVLERFLRLKPASVGVLAASRSRPAINLSRLRLEGSVLEIGADELRFRVWEVERLFTELYGRALGAEEAAELTRRTNGWAAGLHLFHLGTRSLSTPDRRRWLSTLSGSSRLVREYLVENLVREIPPGLRSFLVHGAVLRVLSEQICNAYLGRTDSAELIAELDRRNLVSLGSRGEYRVHEVLRSYLEDCLIAEIGEDAVRSGFGLAGHLYERAGFVAHALHAFIRAEDHRGVARLLARKGPVLALDPMRWIDLLPRPVVSHDPWLLLGSARHHRLAGRWMEALGQYAKAERAAATQSVAGVCRQEREALEIWLRRPMGSRFSAGLGGAVRAATVAVGKPPEDPSPAGRLAAGLVALLAGDPDAAERALTEAASASDLSPVPAVGARMARAAARLLREQGPGSELAGLIASAEDLGASWLAWMGRALYALTDRSDGLQMGREAKAHFRALGDPWGEGLSGLLVGLGALRRSDGDARVERELAESRELFDGVGAGTLVAWCACVAVGLSPAGAAVGQGSLGAESLALSASIKGPLAVVYRSLAVEQPARASQHLGLAERIESETGWGLRTSPSGAGPIEFRCFGEFRCLVDGKAVDLTRIKPKARQLLMLLAVHFPHPIHREVIGGALWPEMPERSVRRNLQVAVHSVRRLLQEELGLNGTAVVVRVGESYGLGLPSGARVDHRRFAELEAEAGAARARGDPGEAESCLTAALDLYEGDLLSGEGPAEWVVAEREACRARAVEIARALAAGFLKSGRWEEAAGCSEWGLKLDRYHDGLWRCLISAHRSGGNRAAEQRSRQGYRGVLAELGLTEVPAV